VWKISPALVFDPRNYKPRSDSPYPLSQLGPFGKSLADGAVVLFIYLNMVYHMCVRKPVLGKFAVGTGIVSTQLPVLGPYLVFCFISSKASSGGEGLLDFKLSPCPECCMHSFG